jgi:glutamine synthetase
MVPDLDRLVVLRDPAGWAWAPGDRFTQDGSVYANCQRSFARAQVAAAAAQGISALMAFEVEWMVGQDTDAFTPAFAGTGYGLSRFVSAADYLRDVVDGLEAAGVAVEQIHPEYGPAQFEVSVAAEDPVSAADTSVLVKLVISAVSAQHGLRASFAPAVVSDNVGNGGHLHASFWKDGANLLAGGDGRYGLTPSGESILAALPAAPAVPMGRRVPDLGHREPRGRPAPDRGPSVGPRQGERRAQVLRPQRQSLPAGGRDPGRGASRCCPAGSPPGRG